MAGDNGAGRQLELGGAGQLSLSRNLNLSSHRAGSHYRATRFHYGRW